MIPQIKKYIQTNWHNFFDIEPESIQTLLLSNPQGKKINKTKCTVLVFKNEEEAPSIVAKYMRVKNSEFDRVSLETEFLKQMQPMNMSPISYGIEMINGRTVAFESYVAGKTLKVNLQKTVNSLSIESVNEVIEQISKDFDNTATAYRRLDDVQIRDTTTPNDYVSNAFEQNRSVLYKLLDTNEQQQQFLDRIIKDYLNKDQSPQFTHFDFTPSNIIVHNGEYNIIDFEFSGVSVHSFIDPFRYTFYYYYALYELNLFNAKSAEATFYEFFKGNKVTQKIVENFFTKTVGNYDEKLFFEYMSLFLLSNLQLQVEETTILNQDFVKQTGKLLNVCLSLINEQEITFTSEHYEQKLNYAQLMKEYKKNVGLLNEYHYAIEEKDQQLEENKNYIEHCHTVIEGKDADLKSNEKYIAHCHEVIQEKDNQLLENQNYIQTCHQTIEEKDKQINELQQRLQSFEFKKGTLTTKLIHNIQKMFKLK